MKVYLVDDDYVFYEFLKAAFPDIEVIHFTDGYSFLGKMEKHKPDRVIVDLHFDKIPDEKLISKVPAREGLVIAKRVREAYPEIPVLLVSRRATAEVVRELRNLGIPFLDGFASFELTDRKLREFFGFVDEKSKDRKLKQTKELFEKHGFFTSSKFILQQLMEINLTRGNRENILIVGETGTGKTFLSRVLHHIIFPPYAPFQVLNLTRVPEHLIESELFGYEKGAFTGAIRSKAGYLEMAGGGTLLIDEIGYLNYQQQGKLLNAIEGGYFSRVGSTTKIVASAKIIGATSSDPAKDLREDLIYRFSNIIYLPPLRERKEDIKLIVEKYREKGLKLTKSAERFLTQADFPGNIRMLLNILESFLTRGMEITLDEAIKIYEKWSFEDRKESFVSTVHKTAASSEEELLDYLLEFLEENNLNLKKLEEMFMKYLLNKGLKMEKIASLFGISRATAFRIREKLRKE